MRTRGRSPRRIAAFALASTSILAACGSAEEVLIADTTVATDTSAAPDTVGPVDSSAPVAVESWSSPLVGGGTFSFAEARAKGPFGLWFWAPG